ncbi:unnamed protein product [Macrosiphum euphorbiae]|uniref:Uncharacterized protein n=1 Tax=Macrosiphum euphorbiae TaxID=13131 RepID=A0AAV0XQV4_9HEMI|nr:unnamed protein product [Macrosiphum euphorbiae]
MDMYKIKRNSLDFHFLNGVRLTPSSNKNVRQSIFQTRAVITQLPWSEPNDMAEKSGKRPPTMCKILKYHKPTANASKMEMYRTALCCFVLYPASRRRRRRRRPKTDGKPRRKGRCAIGSANHDKTNSLIHLICRVPIVAVVTDEKRVYGT